MYEEDRLTALAMYERMFDETADEQGLLQLLVSPTRQAVVLARSYDAKVRKLQIESRSQDDNYLPDPEDVPSFVFIIDKTAQQAAELGVKEPAVIEDQVSIFDIAEEMPEAESSVEVAAEELPALEAEIEAEAAEPAVELPEVPLAAEEEAEPEAPADGEEEALSDVEETANALDAFLADFSIENGELVSLKTEEESEEAAPAVEDTGAEAVETEESETVEAEAVEEEAPAAEPKVRTNIFLLILYIFISIPVGLAGIALLLIPAALFMVLAIALAYVGVSVLGMCFGSFAVIADLMVVFGAGLILMALALLFAWLFIWFIVGVIFGFVRGICRLGRKICCKEVAAQ